MSLGSTNMILRALDRLAAEHTRRAPTDPHDDLVAWARRLRAEAEQLRLPAVAGEAALREGEIVLAAGRARTAIAILEAAVRELTGTLATHLLGVAVARTAEAYLAVGATDRVLALCADGIALMERDRHKTTAPYLQAAYLRRAISLYTNGVRAAYELGDGRMLTWMELSKGRALPRAGRDPADAGESAELEAQLADLGRQIDEYRSRHGGADPLPLRRQRRGLFDRFVTLGARARPAAAAFDLDRVRRALAPDQRAVSYYWVDPARLLIVVVSPSGATSHLQTVDADQRRAVDDLAGTVLDRPDDQFARRVTDRVLDPLLARIAPVVLPAQVRAALAGARRLLVAPHRALHAVPFAALPFGGRRLLHAMAVATIPNLTCLQVEAEVPPLRVLTVGVVDYSLAAAHARPASAALGPAASGLRSEATREDAASQAPGPARAERAPSSTVPPRLRSAEREASEVAGVYAARGTPARALLGAEAREDTLRRLLSDPASAPTCLHLALHGASVESDTPLESWLLLAASRLDGLHLVHWRLDGATVVLSACCSGQRAIAGRGMAELPGDDLFGLQGAFFAAGARQVLGALWQVDGGIARPLTLAFHRGLLDGLPADVALREATIHHLDTDLLHTTLAHWAPFFLMCAGVPQRIGMRPA